MTDPEATEDLLLRLYTDLDMYGTIGYDLLDDDFRLTLNSGPPLDTERAIAALERLYTGFPDLTHEVLDVLSGPTGIATSHRIKGTHDGPYAGRPATGRHVLVNGSFFARTKDHKFTSLHLMIDTAGLLQQIEARPVSSPPRRVLR